MAERYRVDVILPCLDEVAAHCGALVVSEPRRGYGPAVDTGLRTATAEIVCVLNADGSLAPARGPVLGLVRTRLCPPATPPEGHRDRRVGGPLR